MGRPKALWWPRPGKLLPDANPKTPPSIGRAIVGTRCLSAGRCVEAVAAESPGEIHLGGAGVARGYRNQPGLTAAKFLPDPFRDEPGASIYKTGDLARMLPDGRLIFLGRADDQIKIQGYRIEPNEIMIGAGQASRECVNLWSSARADNCGEQAGGCLRGV